MVYKRLFQRVNDMFFDCYWGCEIHVKHVAIPIRVLASQTILEHPTAITTTKEKKNEKLRDSLKRVDSWPEVFVLISLRIKSRSLTGKTQHWLNVSCSNDVKPETSCSLFKLRPKNLPREGFWKHLGDNMLVSNIGHTCKTLGKGVRSRNHRKVLAKG